MLESWFPYTLIDSSNCGLFANYAQGDIFGLESLIQGKP
jgi:hypothetical protein